MLEQLLPQDRPRERAYRVGLSALADAELLALVLGTGGPGRDTLAMAHEALAALPIGELARASPLVLERLPGIGPAKACRVAAAFELGRRSAAAPDLPAITSSREIAAWLAPQWQGLPQEQFGIVLLNTRHRVVGLRVIALGTIDASLVHPRDVFREAVASNAAALIAAHNHPSGNPEPSPADQELTGRLIEAGLLLGIPVLDHLILGEGQYHSFADQAIASL